MGQLTAHLLGEHDDRSSDGGASNAGDGEEFEEPLDVSLSSDDLLLLEKLDVDVVEVSASLDFVVAKSYEGAEGLRVAAFLHEPAWGFRAEVDEAGQRQRRDEGRAELETPSDATRVGDHDVADEAQKDAESGPQL